MKLCKDCKHYRIDPTWDRDDHKEEYARCALTEEPVNGKPKLHCYMFRYGGFIGARLSGNCGKEGRFWEEK